MKKLLAYALGAVLSLLIPLGAHAVTLPVNQGGTGATFFTVGNCLKGNGINAITSSSCGGTAFGQGWEIDANGYLAPTTTKTALLNGGFVSQASSTISSNLTITGNSTTTNATTTSLKTTTLGVGTDYLTDITGPGLSISGSALGIANGAITNAMLANSSLTVNGQLISLGSSGTITAASSTLLANNNNFTGTNTFGSTITGSITGNAGTATILQNTRTINGVNFNGSTNIVVASTTLLGDINSFAALNTFANILVTGSSTLQNFTALNSTSTNATSSAFAILTIKNCNTANALTTNSLGSIVCAPISGSGTTPGGADTQVQFNDGGATFGGNVNLTFTKSNGLLTSLSALFTNATTTNFLATGSSTLQNFTGLQSTTTNSTSTAFFATTASSSKLFTASFNGAGLVTCNGGSFLTWTAGLYGCSAGNAGTVTSVSGTANRITSTGGATPQIDISSSYVGQASITTIGTLSSGAVPASLVTAGTFAGNYIVNGQLEVDSSSTLQNFTGLQSTTTNSTSTNLFSGTASSTSLFFTTANGGNLTSSGLVTASTYGGGGLATCTGNSQSFHFSAGLFSCATLSGFASSSLLGDNNNFSGTGNQFANLLVTGSSTLQNFTGLQSTTTNSTSTNIYSNTASTTNLFAITGNLSTLTVTSAIGAGTRCAQFTSTGALQPNASACGSGGGSGGNSKWATSTTANYPTDKGIYPNGVNIDVGIGTTTPQWSLQVSSSTGAQLALSDGSLTSNPWTFRSAGSNLYIGTSSPSTFASTTNPTLTFYSQGAENVGRVGIGSSTPYKMFSVDCSQPGGCVDFTRQAGLNPAANAFGTFNVNLAGSGTILSGTGPTFTFSVNGNTMGNISALTDGAATNGELNFNAFFNGTGLQVLSLRNSAIGAAGVGTSTPYGALDVAQGTAGNIGSSLHPQLVLTDMSAGVNLKHIYASSTAGELAIGSITDLGVNNAPWFQLSTLGSTSTNATTTTSFASIASSTKLFYTTSNGGTLTSTGNISASGGLTATAGSVISVTTPGRYNIFASGAATAASPDIRWDISASNSAGIYSPASSNLGIETNGVENARYTAGQFYGNGTTTPRWLEQLATSTRSQLTLSDGLPADNHWSFRNAGGFLYFATSSPTTFATSSTAAFVITPNGNIGVGTSTPGWGGNAFNGTTTIVGQLNSVEASTSAAAGASLTNFLVDWAPGNTRRIDLTANATVVISATSSNPVDGGWYALTACQDGTGGRTLTIVTPGQISWGDTTQAGNATTVVKTTANWSTTILFHYDAHNKGWDGNFGRYEVPANGSTTAPCTP